MPELPEVETVRRGLADLLPGQSVVRAKVFDSPKSFPNSPADVEQFLYGARVRAVRRRAKVLMIDLDTNYSLVIHLKMTGQLIFRQDSRHVARISSKISRDPRKVAHIFSEDITPVDSVGTEDAAQIDLPNTAPETEKLATTRQIGDRGEQTAADWLVADGHEIIERNWRTQYCEIDIVSKKDNVLYFTEVKYRKNDNFGDGLAAITNKKQHQMRFAAEMFIAKNPQHESLDMQMLAISVDGNPPAVEECVALD